MRLLRSAFLISVLLTVSLLTTITVSQAQGLSGKEIKRLGNGTARAIAWSADGKQLVVGGSLGLWFFSPDLKRITQFDNNDDAITAIAWNPNGKQLATASYGREVQLWDIASGKFQTIETSKANAKISPNSVLSTVSWPGSVSFSPDGARLASARLDNAVKIWDTTTGKLVSTLKMDGPVYSVAWNPKDARIAVGGQIPAQDKSEGFLQIWDTNTGKMLERYATPDLPDKVVAPVSLVQWTEGGESVAALFNTGNGEVNKWTPGGESFQVAGDIGGSGPDGFSYAPREDIYAIARSVPAIYAGPSGASGIEVYDGMNHIGDVSGSGSRIEAMTWSADGRYLAAIDGDNNLYIVDRTSKSTNSFTLKPLATSAFFALVPGGVSWREDGRLVFTDSQYVSDGPSSSYYVDAVQIKDLLSGDVLWEWKKINTRYGFAARRWSLSPDLKTLAIVTGRPPEENNITLIAYVEDTSQGISPLTIDPPMGTIDDQPAKIDPFFSFFWNQDGSRLAVAGNGLLVTWDVLKGRRLLFVRIPNTYQLSWSPDGRYLAGGYCDYASSQPPFLVDAATGKVLFKFNEVTSSNACGLAWGPLGRSLTLITIDNQVHIWSTASGKLLQTLPGHAIVWSPNGERLAIATEEHTVQLYNTATGSVTATFKGSAEKTINTAFSPDNKRMATADSDGSIRVWDAATGKLLATLVGHKGAVQWVTWKPDSSQLLSYGDDTTLRLWALK